MARKTYKHAIASEVNKERRKRKKIILTVLVFVMVAAIAAEIIVLKGMTSVDRRFIRGVERGVSDGFASGAGDLQLREQGKITDTSFIDTELEAVTEFRNKAYDDKTLKELSKRYIADLEKCKAAAASHDPVSDSEEFWKNFAGPYTDRLIVLRKLYTGDYKMGSSWEEYPEQCGEVLSRAWVAETLSNTEFKRNKSDNGIDRFSSVLKNESGYNIDYITIRIYVYDKNSRRVGTVNVYKEDIPDGSSAELEFYYNSSKIAYYSIRGIDFEIKPEPQN